MKPKNHGAYWSKFEYSALKAELKRKLSIENIAKRHCRTQFAIICAIDRIKNDPSLSDVHEPDVHELDAHQLDIVINGVNYTALLRLASEIINHRIEIMSRMGGKLHANK